MTGAFDQLPTGLPVPVNDGAADHLIGLAVPAIRLPATTGGAVDLATVAAPPDARVVVYLYPMTGRPGVALPDGWDEIPGARGCTPETIGFRDNEVEFADQGVTVFGLSSQDTAYQRELAERLELGFAVLSDERFELTEALSLPTFVANGVRLYTRLTLVLRDGVIEHVFYPVFPTDTHAAEVQAWLAANPIESRTS
jgi:peroxiredoxin